MTYAQFLLVVLVVPIIVLLLAIRRRLNPRSVTILGGISVVALLYTTPWDNYLVANQVWWYDPDLVLGITFGWVPLEEYLFFLLQPFLTGLWALYLERNWQASTDGGDQHVWWRAVSTAAGGTLWVIATLALLVGPGSLTYLGLELVWALPPLLLQWAYGADILRAHWRWLLMAFISSTLYLSFADAVAIRAGTWTIDPAQSSGILIAGILPVEELLFFALTNALIVQSIVLLRSSASQERWRSIAARLHRITYSRVPKSHDDARIRPRRPG